MPSARNRAVRSARSALIRAAVAFPSSTPAVTAPESVTDPRRCVDHHDARRRVAAAEVAQVRAPGATAASRGRAQVRAPGATAAECAKTVALGPEAEQFLHTRRAERLSSRSDALGSAVSRAARRGPTALDRHD